MPVWAWPVIAGAAVAAIGWVIRSTVLDRIVALEAANVRQGKRLGTTEGDIKLIKFVLREQLGPVVAAAGKEDSEG